MEQPAYNRVFRWALAVTLTLGFAVITPAWGKTRRNQLTAKAWYDLAMKHTKSGSFGKAAVAFEAAYKLDPEPTLLYNAARSYHRAGQLQAAKRLYQRYLGLALVSPRDRRAAVAYLQGIDRTLETRRKRTRPGEVRRTGPSGVRRTLLIPQKSRPLQSWGWATLGTGLVVGIVAGVLKGIANGERADLEARTAPNPEGLVWGISQYDAYATRDRANRLDTWALTSAIVSGALLITGAVLLTRPEPKARVGLSIKPGQLTLTAGGSF